MTTPAKRQRCEHDRWPGDDCDICPAPADPIDDLCARLRNCLASSMCDEAADALQRLRAENTELTAEARTANERHHVETERRVRAEAERDTLAAIVRAADEMRAEFGKDMGHWPPAGFTITAYDAARAKWGKP